MSLLVWLPLNGNLTNNGVDQPTITTSAALTYATGGKVTEKCFQSGSQYITFPFNSLSEQMSFCMWLKPNSPSAWDDIICFGQYHTRIECIEDTSKYVLYSNNDRIHTTNTTVLTLNNLVWNHIAVTIDGSTVKFYINGSLYKSFTQQLPLSTVIGNNNSFRIAARMTDTALWVGYINDFRLYDHTLSAKEIKEISKGLVLHYKLSGIGSPNLVNTANPYTLSSAGNVGKSNGSIVLNYKTSGKNDTYFSINLTEEFVPGDTYTVSCDASNLNFGDHCTFALFAQNSGKNFTINKNGRNSYTFTPASSNFHGPLDTLFFDDEYKASTDVYLSNFKIEKGSKSTPWCPNVNDALYSSMGLNNKIEYDLSGFNNHGTKVGTFKLTSDSVRYTGSYMPTDSATYITTTLATSGYANSYSIAYWGKINDLNGRMFFGFGNGNRLNLYPIGSAGFCWNTGDGGNNPFQNNGTSVSYASYNGGWHHYCITGNGTTATLYIDGVKKGTAKTYRSITGTILYISGWDSSTNYKWINGNMSDFRIYATVLSEEDVKLLYSSSASVDKSGNLLAYEFIEE